MNQMSGEKRLRHLFQPVKWVGFDVKNRVKYDACCVSNYNEPRGFTLCEFRHALTPRLTRSRCDSHNGAIRQPKFVRS
jgi:hypothetical protein